jgi:hypothetical protein
VAMTVTMTGGGRTALTVIVLTGASASQPGATTTAALVTEISITPQASGSLVYGSYMDRDSSYPYTAYSAATTILFDADSGFGAEAVAFRSSAVTTASTPVTLGLTAQGSESNTEVIALAEILASGTLAVDASTPPPVPPSGSGNFAGASQTTASFSPPAGSLLVAIAESETSAPTISSSPSLTWTEQVAESNSGVAYASVWTAPYTSAPSSGPVFHQATSPAKAKLPHQPMGLTAFAGRCIKGSLGAPVNNPLPPVPPPVSKTVTDQPSLVPILTAM